MMRMTTGHDTGIPDPKTQLIPSASNLFKAIFMITMLMVSFYATQHGVELLEQMAISHWVKWLLISLAALWDGLLILGMGALAHDAVHKVLFRSLFWNEFWGSMLSSLTLIPFYANRQFHLAHHSHAHQPGLDPENEMHDHSFPVAATAGMFIGLFAQYRILALNVVHGRDGRRALRAIKDALFISVACLVYLLLLPAWGISLLNTLVPMLLLLPLMFTWRALSDHYGIPPILRESKMREEFTETDEETWHQDSMRRRQEVSGWVVLTHPWLEWLWSHVNYHEVHHKYPYLSHQYLPQVFAATRRRHPYLVVDGYWRSMLNLSRRKYYADDEDVRPFLTIPKRQGSTE